ncbi:phosphoglycerate mutase family protein [Hoeflea sp. YIM 152468]|uniref:histidine phosphatase family protein n=1 Tax=Hoeflea sp. YIM 152468 TaxID=3031759 RepID=UPI0023DB3081|nr:histidine phosphatase family protein [Hoeflea sp. YIM 152468]MDF1609040.1 phosphoglycerate mutase family protein [Hoeflea sp. YIM 152468]
MIVRYLCHPQVRIDPLVAVERWGLNEVGRARVRSIVAAAALQDTASIVSSAETKAIETAQPLAEALGLDLIVRDTMHENDRTATGYLPPDEFEAVADQFFASPEQSVRGWERAVDAQARIVAETLAVLDDAPEGDVLLVGHGGVGTLLMCHLAGWPIHRIRGQPAGGGNVFAFARQTLTLRHGWQPMEILNDPQQATLT